MKKITTMKSIKYVAIGLLFIGMTTLMGCKKETQIERNLWSQKKDWKIYEWFNAWNNSGVEGYYANEERLYDIGVFRFNKNGSGMINMDYHGQKNLTTVFRYTVTQNSLTLTYMDDNLFEKDYQQKFDMTWKKNSIVLKSYDNYGNGNYDNYEITLKKDK